MSADKERIAELERKLAEQQAILKRIRATYSSGDDIAPDFVEFIKLSGDTELTILLAKAKEEGRKEAVPEGWQVAPRRADWAMLCAGRLATGNRLYSTEIEIVYNEMLEAAPKPQGETK